MLINSERDSRAEAWESWEVHKLYDKSFWGQFWINNQEKDWISSVKISWVVKRV